MHALAHRVRHRYAYARHAARRMRATVARGGVADAGNARRQPERGAYDPACLNYTLGKLMIRKLRDDWTHDRAGRNAWRKFHDRFLSYGGPPVPRVPTAMLGNDAGALF
jgi:Bacterial protein of unknown function (DUF885)